MRKGFSFNSIGQREGGRRGIGKEGWGEEGVSEKHGKRNSEKSEGGVGVAGRERAGLSTPVLSRQSVGRISKRH